MAEIITVCGPIPPSELGFTSMHEHILADATVFRTLWEARVPEKYKGMWEEKISLENHALHSWIPVLTKDNLRIDDVELMAAEVAEFKNSGGNAIVEQNSITLRVDVEGVKNISQKSGVHVITTTGFYIGPSWPQSYHAYTVEQLAECMVKEVEQGIGETGIRAGHLKVGVLDLDEREERALKAAARASNQTGLSLTVHPGFGVGNDGRRIVDILIKAGMKAERLIIAHGDAFLVERNVRRLILQSEESWGLNLDYHKALLDRGVNLSIDCFGHRWTYELVGEVLENDVQRLAGLVALIKAGYSGQIVLGNDLWIKSLTRRKGGFGYCRLTEYVIPTLRELGVSDYDIRQMTIENPKRLLAR